MQTRNMSKNNLFKTTVLSLFALALGIGGVISVTASPSSNVAWTKKTRKHIKKADLVNGKKLARKCAKCHGADGTDTDVLDDEETPYISGLGAHAIYKQVIDYQDKKRHDNDMYRKTRHLSKQDIADVSVYYANQALPVASVETSKVTPEAVRMATRGAGDRFIPPCAGCHGLNGEGSIVDVPALAGQSPGYFIMTMMAYKEGERTNDIYSRMRIIASELSEKEIKELADYYASIGTPSATPIKTASSEDE